MSDRKPVIFISYSHKDEPDKPAPDEVAWLTFVQSFLAPVVKVGIFDIWVDEHLHGGDVLDAAIRKKLANCDIFVLLASRFSLASSYVVETEIATIRQRQRAGEDVHMFPVLLSPVPNAALKQLKDLVLRPRDAKPLSTMGRGDRESAMSIIADEIATLAEEIGKRKIATSKTAAAELKPGAGFESNVRGGTTVVQFVDISHLPETAYEHLVGREIELNRLDDAWANRSTNILSLVAEGGAGKSALINEWLRILRAKNYCGAEAVLGWSFYSQGSKERATTAEVFLNWAIEKLGIEIQTTSVTAKGEAIAEALGRRRVLLVLDGCEPLQHGLDKQQGELKDRGLRALLRRFASMPTSELNGLVVLTSRLALRDIAGWKGGGAVVINMEQLSDEVGATLLRDNGIWGTDTELKGAAHDFGGHPLALGLLASFLSETQFGDVRRRDHVRAFFGDTKNPRHDHARRVMESYEKEWLADQPVERAIMRIVGLFDRPANDDCLRVLRQKPIIPGLTDPLVDLDENEWRRAVARLRGARLLLPDPTDITTLDAHPLVREWFEDQLKEDNNEVWKAGHYRIFRYLCDTTVEGPKPTLVDLMPLFQAVRHGCHAGRYDDVMTKVIAPRIYRVNDPTASLNYAVNKLGAVGTSLGAISWFFEKPYDVVSKKSHQELRLWAMGEAAYYLRRQGRILEAEPCQKNAFQLAKSLKRWRNAAIFASNLSLLDLLFGKIGVALAHCQDAVTYADRSHDVFRMMVDRTVSGHVAHASGQVRNARKLFVEAELRQHGFEPSRPFLYSLSGFRYNQLLLDQGEWLVVQHRTQSILQWELSTDSPLDKALMKLSHLRSKLGGRLAGSPSMEIFPSRFLDQTVDELRNAESLSDLPFGLLALAALRRSAGYWHRAARDLDEVEEIAEPGPMRLFLCDMALERVRLEFAQIEAFAPLNGLIDDSPPKPVVPDGAAIVGLKEEAAEQLASAAHYIKLCGYHRRDEELAELQAVLRGERKFADLPPRV